MPDTLTDFIILALAAWRLAYMLVEEDGPGAVFSRLRYRAGVRSVVTKDGQGNPTASRVALKPWSELFLCTWCVAVWTAAVLAVPWPPIYWLRLVLAASAGAVLAHEAVERMRR